MTDQHTPGPLSIFVDNRAPEEINLMSGKLFVAVLVGGLPDATTEANARRLMACWNACTGISTESLEQNGVASMEQVREIVK